MARTAPPAPPAELAFDLTPAPATVPAPAPQPAPPVPAQPSPTANWPSMFTTEPEPADEKPARRSRGRGLPMTPVVVGASNATAMTITAAFQIGGPVAAAATGVAVAAGATAATLRRRATTRSATGFRNGGRSATRDGGRSGRGATGGAPLGSRSATRHGTIPNRGATRSATGGNRRSATPSTGSSSGSRSATRGATTSPASAATTLRKKAGRDSASGFHSATGPGATTATGTGRGAGRGTGSRHTPHQTSPRTAPGHAKPGMLSTLKAALGRGARAAARDGSLPRNALGSTGRTTLRASKATGRGLGHAGTFLGRQAAKAWQATADHRAKTAAALARTVKKTPGAAADGSLALLAGLGTWLRRLDVSAALHRLRDVWLRRRARRAAKTAKQTPTIPQQTVASTVRRPHATPGTTGTFGGTMTTSGSHFVAPAMEMVRLASNYNPAGMLQVGEDFAGLGEALQLNAEAMRITVDNADATQPLDPRIIDIMREVHGLQLKAAELAAELTPAFENLHQVDLDRLRNPRKGAHAESMWDVNTNLF